mmetsp:Transcript_13105/g.33154  ORF Transcript_13105/g.33154 Transcript_13105/m.33154 type:complete len:131 (-) Transcript_13105:2919-3311(-)
MRQGLLEEVQLLLMQNIGETDAEVAQEAWQWNPVDKELFTSQFADLKIIKHYTATREQLAVLGPAGYAAMARIEREVLLKVSTSTHPGIGITLPLPLAGYGRRLYVTACLPSTPTAHTSEVQGSLPNEII